MGWLRTLLARAGGRRAVLPALAAGLPFELMAVPVARVAAECQRLRARGDCTPVLLGEADDAAALAERLGGREADVAGILHDARHLELAAWRRERMLAAPDLYTVPPASWPEGGDPPAVRTPMLDWLERGRSRTVLLGLLPTTRSWEAPAHLAYGGWNACPPPEAHVAWHRDWHARWGSEIVALGPAVLECSVASPPRTRAEALRLAREQFVYCPDIVQQGTQSVEGLAALLLGTGAWYFWWG